MTIETDLVLAKVWWKGGAQNMAFDPSAEVSCSTWQVKRIFVSQQWNFLCLIYSWKNAFKRKKKKKSMFFSGDECTDKCHISWAWNTKFSQTYFFPVICEFIARVLCRFAWQPNVCDTTTYCQVPVPLPSSPSPAI